MGQPLGSVVKSGPGRTLPGCHSISLMGKADKRSPGQAKDVTTLLGQLLQRQLGTLGVCLGT